VPAIPPDVESLIPERMLTYLPASTLHAPLTTVKSEARHDCTQALTLRPLGLDAVRDAARAYHDALVAANYDASEIEATGRQEMSGYRYCFTHYDKQPVFGLHVAAAIAEGFGINWRLRE
jgi:hypothetical protein